MTEMKHIIPELIEILEKDSRICAAFLLGSSLSDRMRPDSDFDLAILPAQDTKLDGLERNLLGTALFQKIGKPVDIGLLSSHNLIYTKEAILNGREIYCNNRTFTDLMTTTFLGMYVMFQEERSEVLDAYRA